MIDVLVFGVGRSGTSTTARVLHERFGVCFGHHARLGTLFRGDPLYEHPYFKEQLAKVLSGVSSSIEDWHQGFVAHHGDAECEARWTGVKLLTLAELSPEQIKAFHPVAMVRTFRPKESCIRAWRRYNQRPWSWAERRYNKRERQIEKIFSDSRLESVPKVTITFDPEERRLDDDEVEARLDPTMRVAYEKKSALATS